MAEQVREGSSSQLTISEVQHMFLAARLHVKHVETDLL